MYRGSRTNSRVHRKANRESARTRLRTCLLGLLLIALAPSPIAHAADDPEGPAALKNLSLEELSQIEVTTLSKVPEQAFRVPAAIYVITGEDIHRSGATSIPEALRMAPGVEVARIDGNKWAIGIRGFGSRLSRSVLVLIDGRTVYTTLLAGTYWEVQDTVMDDIDRIEVIRGPGGTIWGPNAVNGVINIITKGSKDTHGVLASVGSGNEEQGFLNFRYGGGNDKDFNYRVYVKGFTRGPEVHSDNANFDDWRAAQAGFRTDWNHGKLDSFTVQGDLYYETAGERVDATSYTAPFDRIIDANAHNSGGNIMGRWKHTLGSGDDLQLQAYYDRTNRHESNFGEDRDTFDVDFLQHFRQRARQEITYGLGARFSTGDDTQVVSGLTFDPAKRTDRLLTAFLQDEINLVENRLSLTVGSKLIRTNFTGIELEPSARLLWTPDNSTSIWAAFTHALRTPSDADHDFFLSGFIGLAADGTPFFARFNANRNFRSEQLNGYELGIRQLIGKNFYVDVATFYNHYHDLFSEEITGTPFVENTPPPTHILLPAQFANGLYGHTKGIEISPEWRPTTFWRLRGTYSYLHMDLGIAPGSADVGSAPGIEGASPQHQVTLQSGFDFAKVLTLDLSYRFVSELVAQKVPAYHSGDISFGWRFSKQCELSLVGQNLLQPSHGEFAGDPGPLVGIRRSGYAKLTFRK